MALPVGVQTKTLNIGRPFDALGNSATLKITVTPFFGGTAQRLVWSATGDTFEAMTVTPPAQHEPDGDLSETIDLPIVDQAGWIDGSGNAITGWQYQVSVTPTFTVGGVKTRMKTYTKFVSPTSTDSSPIDMDRLPDGTAAAPILAAGPTVTEAQLNALSDTLQTALSAKANASSLGAETTRAAAAEDALTTAVGAKAALSKVAATVSASGAAVANRHNPVNASGAARSISLPTGQAEGTHVSVEKVDSSTNAVSVTGNIRGVGSSTLSLVWQYESVMFRADSAGSWWPVAGHKTKTSLDGAYATKATETTVAGVQALTDTTFTTALKKAFVGLTSPPRAVDVGGTDATAQIADALASTDVTEVHLKDTALSYYILNSELSVPKGKGLVLPHGTAFVPGGNNNILALEEDAYIQGGILDISGYTGYTGAALVLRGTSTYGTPNVLTTARDIRIKGKSGASGEGYGILLDTGTIASNRISYVQFENIHIRGTGTAISLYSHDTASGTGVTWVNSNLFRGVTVSQAKRCLDILRDATGSATGNDFDIVYQTAAGVTSALLNQGRGNTIKMFVWDWDTTVGTTTVSTTLTETSNENVLTTNEPRSRISDKGNTNRVTNTNASLRTGTRILGRPGAVADPAKYGDQDDWLAYATQRGITVTQTTGTAPSAGSLANMFDPNATNTATFDAGPVVVEIDWTTSQRPMSLGAAFANGNRPTSVTLEVYKSGAYVSVYSTTTNAADTIQHSPVSPNSFGITKARWTFSGFTSGKTAIEVERLWMFEGQEAGKAWTPSNVTRFARKTTTTTRNNTNTPAADTDLTVTIEANAVYEVTGLLHYDATTTGDLLMTWGVPSGTSFIWAAPGPRPTAATQNDQVNQTSYASATSTHQLGGVGTGSRLHVRPSGILAVGSTAGSLTLKWSQNTAEVSDVNLFAGSYLKLTRIA